MHDKYFKEAQKVALLSTCDRAHCGAVIVAKDGQIIGIGYNAPPLGDEAQRMCDAQLDTSIKPDNDKTCCVHAEWKAIMDALKNHGEKILGSTLYSMRIDEHGEGIDAGEPYCTVCSRLALESGIETFGLWNGDPEMISTEDYNKRSYKYFL